MCAIVGALVWNIEDEDCNSNKILNHIMQASQARGRDGFGWNTQYDSTVSVSKCIVRTEEIIENVDYLSPCENGTFIANFRAEPTTEFVREKTQDDQQPYYSKAWSIVHNGTIANDKELRSYEVNTTVDSAAIVESLEMVPAQIQDFVESIQRLKGSYAILATHATFPEKLFFAANYRPIWYIKTQHGYFFASARDYFPEQYSPKMIQPYTAGVFTKEGVETVSLYADTSNDRALVVCSGGMDSVVAATYAKTVLNMDIHLIHFQYGCRAEGPEVTAIKAVAKELDVPLTLFPLNIYEKGDSPLFDHDSKVAGGEEGAEFAHEWVPARNLVMLSVATAFAEAKGITTIVLGNNLEEAGAYPDNEPEFINRFNDILPFAVGDGKRMNVIMPVGNLMKHEIVTMGKMVNAPLHLTWSCYRAGEKHCGTCGPCYMRKTAFEINQLEEVIDYEV